MSGPLRLTADQLLDLGEALRDLSQVRIDHGVLVGGWGPAEVRIGDVVLKLVWDNEAQQYVVDDGLGG